jgi:photosystem II stability/assembly factor-like uncharacterized protein
MARSSQLSSGSVVLLLGTKRGLVVMSSPDRKRWEVAEPLLSGQTIYNAALDQRGGSNRLFAADNNVFFGSVLRYSDDFGETWQEPKRGIQFSPESGLKLQNIWIIQFGRTDDPDTVYAGVDPASLWVSHDRGDTWEINQALANHPTRDHWNPGAGGLCLHTIIPDYSSPQRMWVGISAVGCVRTDDGGETWQFANKNTRAGFQPDVYPEFGQCLHRMVQHPTKPDTLYQQNHCGIYRSDNAGDDWVDIQNNLPSDFGFPIALDAHRPETVYTIVEHGMGRHNVTDQFTVYRTQNAGETWESLTEGLPSGASVRLGVLRHGMCADTLDPCGIYVGTNTGQLFASNDRGDSWTMIAEFLPSIYSVNAAVIA